MNVPGYLIQRQTSDGRFVGVVRLTFGRARLVIGDQYALDDGW
jgi:hypothetical protein